MAKQQEFIESFNKFDQDKDGEINQPEFISLVVELGFSELYQGSVNKMIRKINYNNPERQTLNFQQAKEYYESLETESKHQIFKQKYTLLETISEFKEKINLTSNPEVNSSAAPGAAPGQTPPSSEQSQNPSVGNLTVLVGNKKPYYKSFIEFECQKSSNGDKSKPFVKLNFTSKSNERAKQLQVVFKDTYENFISLFAQQTPQWALQVKRIHISSFVKDCSTTFFITSTSEDIVNFIQLIAQVSELLFSFKLEGKAHLQFSFDYDFQDFIKHNHSSFYEIFTKDNQLSVSVNLIGFMKALRMLVKATFKDIVLFNISGVQEYFQLISLIHLQGVEGEFQFENSSLETYEVESKHELKQILKQLGWFFGDLEEKNIKFRSLLQLLDEVIQIELNNGQWKSRLHLRLKNFNKIFTELTKETQGEKQQVPQNINMAMSEGVEDSSSQKSYDSKSSKKKAKVVKKSSLYEKDD